MKEQFVLRLKSVEPGIWFEGLVTCDEQTSVTVTTLIFNAAVFDRDDDVQSALEALKDLGFLDRFETSMIMQGGSYF